MKTWEALQLGIITLLTSLLTYIASFGSGFVISKFSDLVNVNVEILAPIAFIVVFMVGPVISSVIAITVANLRIDTFSGSTPISQRKRKLALILVGVGALLLTLLWAFLIGVLPNLHLILANSPRYASTPPVCWGGFIVLLVSRWNVV